jgi:predicted MFS family arabinose efflux permease
VAEIHASLQHRQTVFDGWRSISLSLYMALVGYGVLVGIPVISTAWVELLGFTEVQVGRVAGADLGGLSLGAILTSLVIGNMNRRFLVVLGIGLAVAANGLCFVYVEYEIVLWLRVIAGIGSGIYTAVAVATLGATSRPARAFNMLLFAFAFSQALEMHFLPLLPINGIYGAFILFYLLTLPFIHWMPPHPEDKKLDVELDVEEPSGEHHIEHRHVPTYVPWLVLAAIFVTYINIGAYWTYIELASLDAGVPDEWISPVLTWSSLFSLVGCLVATIISNRWGLARPLFLSLIAMATIVSMLATGIGNIKVMLSLFSFNTLWIFVDVYQMATVANVDHSGSYASLMPGAQGLGQIVGPNIAASILGANMGYSVDVCSIAQNHSRTRRRLIDEGHQEIRLPALHFRSMHGCPRTDQKRLRSGRCLSTDRPDQTWWCTTRRHSLNRQSEIYRRGGCRLSERQRPHSGRVQKWRRESVSNQDSGLSRDRQRSFRGRGDTRQLLPPLLYRDGVFSTGQRRCIRLRCIGSAV